MTLILIVGGCVVALMGLAAIAVTSFAGGPICPACGWTRNQCEESCDTWRRPCCARCSHPRPDGGC
jgi:hypothetical protein